MRERLFMPTPASACLIVSAALFVSIGCRPNSQQEQVTTSQNSELQPQNTRTTQPDKASVATVSNRPLQVSADGYQGASACQKCHQEQFDSWHSSYHRTMTQVVTPETAPEVIRNTYVTVAGQTYQFGQENEKFYVQLNDPTVGGQPRRRELVMMTGSHHMHVFWYESDFEHTPAQLPILYLRDEAKWIPRQSAFLQPPGEPTGIELGRWNQSCSNCHSTHPRQRLQKETRIWDTQVSDFGIACEACHGPGEGHMALHEKKTATAADDVIVNPDQLPHAVQSDVCGQCHSVHAWNFDALSEEDFFSHGKPFRPGKSLKKIPFVEVVQGSPEHWKTDIFKKFADSPRKLNGHFWMDGEVRVSGRDYTGMIESPCFQRGELSCFSCHSMHEKDPSKREAWRDDQLKSGMRTNEACIQCHGEYEKLGSAHTHHPIGSSGSECMNCHMPHTTYGLLKTIRSHRISSPAALTTIQTGRPNACNLCHLDQTLEWAADHLADWYGHETPKFTAEEKTVAASLLHLLKGDAGLRAIQVSAFNWKPAQEVSGTQWMRPYLLLGMNDPYDAIRVISERSLRSISDDPPMQYDFLAPVQQRNELIRKEMDAVQMPSEAGKSALLIDDDGKVDRQRLSDLLKRRNQTPVELLE